DPAFPVFALSRFSSYISCMNSRLAALSLLAFAIPLALPAQRSDPIDDMRYRQHERRIADAERQRAETDRRLRQLEFEQERERWRNELRNRRWSGEDVSR